jgi:hypothetical protein
MIHSMQDEERSSLDFAMAAIINFLFMLLMNAHDAWRPMLGGIVTESFDDVLWAVNLGCVLQIFGNLILSVTSPDPLRRFSELVFAVGALVAAVVFYRVFPLDLARFGEPAVVLGRVIAFLGVAAASMTILVNFMRLVGPLTRTGERGTHAPLPPGSHSGA